MIFELIAGTVGAVGMASGIGALVFWKKNGNGNGHSKNPWRYDPPLQQQQSSAPVQIEWPAGLQEALAKAANPLEVISAQPPWHEVVGELERITQRVLVAAKRANDPAPEWATRLASDLAENDKRLAQIAEGLSENMTDGMARFYSQVSKDLAAAVDLPALVEISDKLETIVDAIPEADPRPELTAELSRQLADLPARIGRNVAEVLAAERARVRLPAASSGTKLEASGGGGPLVQGGTASGGGRTPTPPKPRERSFAPLNAPGTPVATPSIPAPYVAGSVFVPAGEVFNLLALIQQQLSPNCPGTAVEFQIAPDPENQGGVLLGGASIIGGPLATDNYAYEMTATTPPRVYRSSFPGTNTPVGELQVLSPTAGNILHVEVTT